MKFRRGFVSNISSTSFTIRIHVVAAIETAWIVCKIICIWCVYGFDPASTYLAKARASIKEELIELKRRKTLKEKMLKDVNYEISKRVH